MIEAIRILFLAGVVVLAAALLPASPPTAAQTPCEADEHCVPELRRACAGTDCGCFACRLDMDMCCHDQIVVRWWGR